MIQRMPDSKLDEVVAEKKAACDLLEQDQAMLQKVMSKDNQVVLDPMMSTLIYASSMFQMLHHLLAGLIAYRRFQKKKDPRQAQLCRQRLLASQSDWTHHTQRTGTLPGVATTFREAHFWEFTQEILAELEGVS